MLANRTIVLLVPLALAVTASAAAATRSDSGRWQRLPVAPVAPEDATSVWAGDRLLVFGRDQRTALDAHGNPYSTGSVNVAAAYDPAARRWRRLTPPKGPTYSPGPLSVWTGKEMLVWGPFDYRAYNPRTNRWRPLPPPPTARGFAVWTGREMIGWGGGCCGDAFTDGSAYNPGTNRWRRLPRSPLAGSQRAVAVWTGRELNVLVGDSDPATGKPWPAKLARAAAYDPAANRWRRIARLPVDAEGAVAAWDGHEVLAVRGRSAYAYSPAANRWRRLASPPATDPTAVAVWTGDRLVLAGGRTEPAYDPRADRWSLLARAPLPPTLIPTAAWTGRSLLVWGVVPTRGWGSYRSAGAVTSLAVGGVPVPNKPGRSSS